MNFRPLVASSKIFSLDIRCFPTGRSTDALKSTIWGDLEVQDKEARTGQAIVNGILPGILIQERGLRFEMSNKQFS